MVFQCDAVDRWGVRSRSGRREFFRDAVGAACGHGYWSGRWDFCLSSVGRVSELLCLTGNLPIDSAVFLGESPSLRLSTVLTGDGNELIDFAPASHQYLLTFMSIFWCLGQLLVNLVSLFVIRILGLETNALYIISSRGP
jgi:hypothetical protein